MAGLALAANDIARFIVPLVRRSLDVVTANKAMAHIDWIKRKASRFAKAAPGSYAWYHRMPWVLAVAAAVMLLVYAVAVSEVIGVLCRGLVCVRGMPARDVAATLPRKVVRN